MSNRGIVREDGERSRAYSPRAFPIRSRTTIDAAMSPAAGGTKATEPGTERRPTQVRSFFGQMQC